MFVYDIVVALLLLLLEMSPFFRVLALGPTFLAFVYLYTDVLPAWYTELSNGTIPGVIQWMIWLALFPLWWKLAPAVRSSIPFAFWMLGIVAVPCTIRPWIALLQTEDEEGLDISVVPLGDNEPLFSVAGRAIDIPLFWSYPLTAYFLSRVDVGYSHTRVRLILDGFAGEVVERVSGWFYEVMIVWSHINDCARSSPPGAYPTDGSLDGQTGKPL